MKFSASKHNLKSALQEVQQAVNETRDNTPSQRALIKKGYSFSTLPPAEQLVIWDYIWHTATEFWTRFQPIFYCETQLRTTDFLIRSWDVLKEWQHTVENWYQCDMLSKIYTKMLERIPDQVLPQLQIWNTSTRFWDRRQSIVSLLYYTRTKKRLLPFETIAPLITRLLHDEEYYVQKGVGWSLRELYNAYPDQTLALFERHILEISGIAFSPATEKLNRNDKVRLKTLRKGRIRQAR